MMLLSLWRVVRGRVGEGANEAGWAQSKITGDEIHEACLGTEFVSDIPLLAFSIVCVATSTKSGVKCRLTFSSNERRTR